MTNTDANQYRAYWATATGKNPSEIYVPLALRDEPPADPESVTMVVSSLGGRKAKVTVDVDASGEGYVSGTVTEIEEV